MIGFGLIGCGRIAERHVASVAKCEKARLTALCDVQEERMNYTEQKYREQTASEEKIAKYRDVGALLRDDGIQAVIISTPSAFHAELAKQAIASGKHVILEKPMALSLYDAEEIVRMSEQHQVIVQVCHQLRYRPLMKRIKELIQTGAMGHVFLGVASMRLNRSKSYYEDAPWRGTWDLDGGMLLNQGIHLVDLLQWFMGDCGEVYASMLRGTLPKQTEDVAAGIVKFQNRSIGVIEANTLTYPSNFDNSITLFGEKGTVSIGGIGLNEIRKWSFADPSAMRPVPNDDADEHFEMYRQFIHAVEGIPGSSVISASEGKKALEIIFALYHSVKTQQAVKMPITGFSTSTMAEMEEWK